MSAMSDYLEGQVRTHIFRTGSFTKPTVLAIALCTAATSDSQTGATITEVANSNGYARITCNPLDASWPVGSGTDGSVSNANAYTFTASGGSWGTITHFAIVDSATHGAGNVLFHGALTTSKTIADGDSLIFNTGGIVVTFA